MHPLVYSGKQVAMFPIPSSLQLAVHFFSHSHYLIYSYYNMDYLYKLKTIEK